MYELIGVSDNCFYIQCPAKVGVVRFSEDRVILIDSGNDKDSGKKIKRILDEEGWTLEAICNTHSHADHCGGNQYLQRQTGCRIYAPGIERDFVEHTILEPSFLYGGYPPEDLKHKFLMAKGSDALLLTEEVLPEGIEAIALPGHSFDMVGFRTADEILYLGDCLSSRETLEKYKVNFMVDVQAYIETLEKVMTMEAKLFVPSHAEPTDDIEPLARMNIDKVYEIGETIVEICRKPMSFDGILKQVFEIYELNMTHEQHTLVGSTIRSYLSWLKEKGDMDSYIEDNMLIWKS